MNPRSRPLPRSTSDLQALRRCYDAAHAASVLLRTELADSWRVLVLGENEKARKVRTRAIFVTLERDLLELISSPPSADDYRLADELAGRVGAAAKEFEECGGLGGCAAHREMLASACTELKLLARDWAYARDSGFA